MTVTLEDAFGNVETADSASSLNIGVLSGPTGAAFAAGSTTSVTVHAGVATFAGLKLDTAGSYILQASDSALGLSSAGSNSFAVSPAAATQVAFGQQPSNTRAGVAISPAVTAKIEDPFGNVETSDNASTLSLAIANGPDSSFAGGSTTSAAVSAGVATFATLTLDTAGIYTLQASDLSAALNGAVSGSFAVTANAATQLIFGRQPTNATAGQALSPAVTVALADQFGNVETADNASSLSIAVATGPSGAGFTADSTTTATVNAGTATFTTLKLDTAGTYTLKASDAALGLSSAASNSFQISPSAATQLTFGQQPTTTTAGAGINPVVTVRLVDPFNNLVTSDNTDTVTLALASGPAGAAGTTVASATASGGIASFTNLTLDTAGAYTLSESATGGLSGANSNSFQIVAGSPSQLAFGVQPGTTAAGAAINPAVTVRVLDPFNNLVTTDNADQVTLAIGSGPGSLAATSTTRATTNGGVATFANLVLDTAGAYTLSESTTGGLSGPMSNGFQITPDAGTHLAFGQQPGTTAAGVLLNPAVTVKVLDQFNNVAVSDNGDTVTVSVASGPGDFTAASITSATTSGGVAAFSNLSIDAAGPGYTLAANDPSLGNAASNSFTITGAAASHFTVAVPSSSTVGEAFTVTVTALDAFGNVATAYAGTVNFTSSDVSATLPASYHFQASDAGIAAFPAAFVLRTAGAQSIVAADANKTAIVGSGSVTVSASDTATVLTTSGSSSVYSAPVTLTAKVSAISPGAGAPFGTVTFMDGAALLQTVAFAGGVATYTTTSLAVGPHFITAEFNATNDFNQSVSAAQTQTVTQANTTTTLTSSAPAGTVNQPITLTAAVNAAAPGTGTVTIGTVSFLDGTTLLATAPLNAAGVATFTTSSLAIVPAPGHVLTAVFGATASYLGSTSNIVDLPIRNTVSAVHVVSSANPSVFGQSVNLTVTVTGASGMPQGGVTVSDAAGTLGTGTLSSAGVVTIPIGGLSAGATSLTVSYAGNNAYGPTSTSFTEKVNPAATTTTLATPSAALFGPVTFTATVASSAAGAGALTGGVVTFKNGTAILGTGTIGSSNQAIFTTPTPLSVGYHSITAVFAAMVNFAASTSHAVTQKINASPTTTTLASTGPSTFGEPVTFTATVAATNGLTPTGVVTFKNGNTVFGIGTLDSFGVATFTTAKLATNANLGDRITAVYGATADFLGSTSAVLSQIVAHVGTAIDVNSSASGGSVVGQAVTFTASVSLVSSGVNLTTGTLSFYNGSQSPANLLGMRTLNASGLVSLTTAALPAGDDAITVVYAGTVNFAACSSTFTQSVGAADTTTTVTSSRSGGAVVGQAVTFTATVAVVSPGAGVLTGGSVTFFDDGNPIGVGVLSSKGKASFTTSALAMDPAHAITAAYNGAANFNGSTSAPLIQAVNAAVASIGLSIAPNPVKAGQPATITAAVSGADGVPTGIVSFYDGGNLLGTFSLDGNGRAAVTLTNLGTGSHSITVTYSGDADYAATTSAALLISDAGKVTLFA